MKTAPLLTWARIVGGRGDGDGYVNAPPNVRRDAFEDRPQVLVWIDKAPRALERPDNPPAWVADETKWERAKQVVKKYWSDYDEPWAVVTHVYENVGGTFR